MHSSVSHNPGRVLHTVRKGSWTPQPQTLHIFSLSMAGGFLHPFPFLGPRHRQTSSFRSSSWERQLKADYCKRERCGPAVWKANLCFRKEKKKKEPCDAWSRSKYLTQPLSDTSIKVSKQNRPVANLSQFPQLQGTGLRKAARKPMYLFYTQAFLDYYLAVVKPVRIEF